MSREMKAVDEYCSVGYAFRLKGGFKTLEPFNQDYFVRHRRGLKVRREHMFVPPSKWRLHTEVTPDFNLKGR